MNNRKDTNRRDIRNSVGLPDDNGKIAGLVSENPYEICENTIGYAPFYARRTQNNDTIKEFRQNQTRRTGRTTGDGVRLYSEVGVREQRKGVLKASKANFGVHGRSMMKHKFFEASGGATSPNTEVNADGQGIASEVPRKNS